MPQLHHRFPLVKMPLFSIPGQGTPQFPPLMLSLDFYPTISSSTLTRLDAPQHLLLKAISFWAEASHEWVWLLGAYVTHLRYNCKGKANNWLLPWGRSYHKLGKFPNIKGVHSCQRPQFQTGITLQTSYSTLLPGTAWRLGWDPAKQPPIWPDQALLSGVEGYACTF